MSKSHDDADMFGSMLMVFRMAATTKDAFKIKNPPKRVFYLGGETYFLLFRRAIPAPISARPTSAKDSGSGTLLENKLPVPETS